MTFLPQCSLRLVPIQQLFSLSSLPLCFFLPVPQLGFAAGQTLQDPHEHGHQGLHHTFTMGLYDCLCRMMNRVRDILVIIAFVKQNKKKNMLQSRMECLTCSSEYSFPASSLTMLGSNSISPDPDRIFSLHSIVQLFYLFIYLLYYC